MSNRLAKETSPYLLQHKDNPVDWYPWSEEAFVRARQEDKPIFLSIGYSACHWCHVLAHESFEDAEIAALLNRHFISVKVDKEERPDIDSVYMSFLQAFTGSGGWPNSIFMTADGKPFFAGTYFPKTSRAGRPGMRELLLAIHEGWLHDRDALLRAGDDILRRLQSTQSPSHDGTERELLDLAVRHYEHIYDEKHGGFGRAPKFPTPHNLLFLLDYYKRYKTASCLAMAEHTLLAMYRGGMFDHIGQGFCRYSTDREFLIPHFEKMLYDNALLILAYCLAHTVTGKPLYLDIAEGTASYILREMTSPDGGFYSSQDADSEGEEGKYYLFTPQEIIQALGQEEGERFICRYGITEAGNFEGKSLPNLLKGDLADRAPASVLSALDAYRKRRYTLHRDEKVLCAWNSLMITAMCALYLAGKQEVYLIAAKEADRYIREHLCDGDTLYVSFHRGKRGARGFLDDYAAYILAQLALHRATLDRGYLERAAHMCDTVLSDFRDNTGGFYVYGAHHEELILRPKETYDGAIPSGNSLMAYALVRLSMLTDEDRYTAEAQRQLDFLSGHASQYPTGHAMLLKALLEHTDPPMRITVVSDGATDVKALARELPADAAVVLLPYPTENYPLKDGRTTYYVCRAHRCLPPTCDMRDLL